MRNIYIAIIMVISSSLFAIEYNQYDMKKIKKYDYRQINFDKNIEDKYPDSLGYIPGEGYGGPNGPEIFCQDENLVIVDQGKNRTIYLDKDYNFNKTYDTSFFDQVVNKINEDILLGFGPSGISITDISTGFEIMSILSSYTFDFVNNSKSAFYHSNILFIHDKDGKLWSIKNPSLDDAKNRKNLLNEEKTLALFKDGDIDGLTIDSEKRLFLNGELQTLDYAVFYKYYKSFYPNRELTIKAGLQVTDAAASSMVYIGYDSDGNYYWRLGQKHMAIFNHKGFTIDFFKYDRKKVSTTPAVSPSGDIYFMHHGEDKVTLYKIERQW